jgi:hypothetical protein
MVAAVQGVNSNSIDQSFPCIPSDSLDNVAACRIASSSPTSRIAPKRIPPRQVKGVPRAKNAELLNLISISYDFPAFKPLTTLRRSMVPSPKNDSPWVGLVLRSITSFPSIKKLPDPAIERPNSQSPSSSGINLVEN